MNQQECITRVKKIVEKVLSTQHTVIKINCDEPITGPSIDAEAVDLVYIVLEIMDEFKVTFEAEDFANYSFNTINSIADLLQRKLANGGVE